MKSDTFSTGLLITLLVGAVILAAFAIYDRNVLHAELQKANQDREGTQLLLKEAKEHLAVFATPTTPTAQRDAFIAHCGDSHLEYDMGWLGRQAIDCHEVQGSRLGKIALICGVKSRVKDNAVGIFVCEDDGCSWGVRNGIGP